MAAAPALPLQQLPPLPLPPLPPLLLQLQLPPPAPALGFELAQSPEPESHRCCRCGSPQAPQLASTPATIPAQAQGPGLEAQEVSTSPPGLLLPLLLAVALTAAAVRRHAGPRPGAGPGPPLMLLPVLLPVLPLLLPVLLLLMLQLREGGQAMLAPAAETGRAARRPDPARI